jgi:hypothetical protein
MYKLLVALGLAMFCGINFVGVSLYSMNAGIGFDAPGRSAADAFPLGGFMLLGIIASALVAGLKALPQEQMVGLTKLWRRLMRPSTFIALLVSPVVFYGVLAGLGDGGLSLIHLFAALQNGFFWETALVAPVPRVASGEPG